MAERRTSVAPPHASEISMRVLWCPATFVADTFGEEELGRCAAAAELDPSTLRDVGAWTTTRQVAAFLAELRQRVESEEDFSAACVYRLKDGYGAARFVVAATTPSFALATAARNMQVVSTVGRCEVLHQSRNRVALRYSSSSCEHETRLVCLSRQAQSRALPTFFGMPAGTVRERKCIARGDSCCEYEYSFYVASRWLPALLGLAGGVIMSLVLWKLGVLDETARIALPVACGLIAMLQEVARTYRLNVEYGNELQDALRQSLEHEAEARRETEALHERQHQWAKLMEEQVNERTRALEGVLQRLRGVGEARAMTLRGFSHDLRNPLAVLRANQSYLRDVLGRDDDMREVMDDNELAINRMERMLRELVESAGKDRALVRVNPETIAVEPLVDILRRRTRALVFGRPIRVSVFRTREAPEEIFTDRLVFERVMDNLCTNAAKYTERGSIVVELDGNPGNLVVKVSDTGCGIEDGRMEGIFHDGNRPDARSAQSLGVGLSVVVQLLAQIGGRLEVMSKPGQGTTFWAHFPRRPVTLPPRELRPAVEGTADAVSTVVTIRRLSA